MIRNTCFSILIVMLSCSTSDQLLSSESDSQMEDSSRDPLLGIVIQPEETERMYLGDLEERIINRQDGHFSPYTLTCFDDLRDTDIEHIVAIAEAYDSGLNRDSVETQILFTYDLDNLTTAEPGLNRHQKSAKDPAEWLPSENRCWYVQTWIDVKRKYGLTMDQEEADAIRSVLSNCTSTDMIVPTCQ